MPCPCAAEKRAACCATTKATAARAVRHLTHLPHTPSIQTIPCEHTYSNWHGAGPHSGGPTRGSAAPQNGAAGNGAEVWREGGYSLARFFRRAFWKWHAGAVECYRGVEAGVAIARGVARTICAGGIGYRSLRRRSGGAFRVDGRRIFRRL